MEDNKEDANSNGSNGSNEKEWMNYEQNHFTIKGDKGIYPKKAIDLSYLEKLYEKDVAHGVAGSQNLGNTCFMNSSIQCLSNSVDLTAYFLSKQFKNDINKNNKLGLGGTLAESWYALLYSLWEERNRSVNARDFKITIAKKAKMFSGFSQHDSHEFMTFFLDYIGEDLNRVNIKPYRELEEQGENESDIDAAQRFWQMHLDRNDSIITDLFTGQFKSTIECPACKWVSKTYDPFSTLSLPIPKLKSFQLFFLPKYGMRKTIKLNLQISKKSLFGDLGHIVKTSHNLEADFEKLRFMIVNDRKMLRLALPKEMIENFKMDNSEYVFCCDTDSKLQGEVTNLPIYFSINDDISAHPRLLSLTKTMTYGHLMELIFFYSRKFIDLPIDQTDYDNEFKTLLSEYTKPSDDLINICKNEYDKIFRNEAERTEEIKNFIENLPYELYLFKDNARKYLIFSTAKRSDNENPIETIDIKDPNEQISMLFTLIKDKWTFHLHFDKNNKYFKNESSKDLSSCRTCELKQKELEVNLRDCFEYFQLTEKLEENNEWYCKKCKKHQLAHKKMELFYLPKLLIIHLKRFSTHKYHSDKINTTIDFPIDDLDMTNFVVGQISQNFKYDLYAVSQHYGGCGGGHYTAICKNNGQWYDYNDGSVSRSNDRSIVSSSAYVLFYRRKDN